MDERAPRKESKNVTGYYVSLFLSVCSVVVTLLSNLWKNQGLQLTGILLLVVDTGILVYYLSGMQRQTALEISDQPQTKVRETPKEESFPVLTLANRVAEILQRGAGARVHVNTALNDRCILDVRAASGESAVGIVLHTANSVGLSAVRGLHSLVANTKVERGFLFTSGTFTSEAVKWAKGKPLFLIDGRALDQMAAKYKVDDA